MAEGLGVSQPTIYNWLARYRAGGQGALYDRNFRPRRSPRRLAVGRAAAIAAMRRMRMNSPQIAFFLSTPLFIGADLTPLLITNRRSNDRQTVNNVLANKS